MSVFFVSAGQQISVIDWCKGRKCLELSLAGVEASRAISSVGGLFEISE